MGPLHLKTFLILGLLAYSIYFSKAAGAAHLGIGLSSAHSGRQIPSISAGAEVYKGFLLSGMMTGSQTKAFYQSTYGLNLLFWSKFGKGFLGETWAGIGAGGYYIERGYVTSFDTREIEKSVVIGSGLGFRVQTFVVAQIYLAVEFMMATRKDFAWGDIGFFAVGVGF